MLSINKTSKTHTTATHRRTANNRTARHRRFRNHTTASHRRTVNHTTVSHQRTVNHATARHRRNFNNTIARRRRTVNNTTLLPFIRTPSRFRTTAHWWICHCQNKTRHTKQLSGYWSLSRAARHRRTVNNIIWQPGINLPLTIQSDSQASTYR